MNVCIGGTFFPFHKGHKRLIDKALQIAGEQGSVFIGITTEKMLKGKGDVKPFGERKKTVEKYVRDMGMIERAIIRPIKDKYGPSIEGEFDAIVVSSETLQTAEEINRRRSHRGKTPLRIVQIPLVLAEDGTPIRSSRIKKEEIDENGRVFHI